MSKKISIFTTLSDPEKRQDPFSEALKCYEDFADEVVVVDGDEDFGPKNTIFRSGLSGDKVKWLNYKWPEEFDWRFIGQQFQRGYDACTGDWAIRCDIDYLLHQDDFDYIREFLLGCDAPAACFVKRQFLKADRYNVKAIMPIAYNKKKYGNRIKLDSGGDLCQPSLDGKEIDKEKMPIIAKKVPVVIHGNITEEQKKKRLSGAFIENGITYTYGEFIPIWNYECLLKTKEVEAKEFYRFARAWGRHFGKNMFGIDSKEMALEKFLEMQIGRYNSTESKVIKLEDHPKYIQETIKNLKPEQFGFNLWNNIK